MKINHVLVRASNLETMNRFLVDAIGLEVGERPPFPFSGSWLYSDGKPVVHVIHDLSAGNADGAVDHVALEGADYDTLLAALARHGIEYAERVVPQSGEHQVFVSGPDGLKVEMLFPTGMNQTQSGQDNESYRFV
jgi:lactoylglutathione lyase